MRSRAKSLALHPSLSECIREKSQISVKIGSNLWICISYRISKTVTIYTGIRFPLKMVSWRSGELYNLIQIRLTTKFLGQNLSSTICMLLLHCLYLLSDFLLCLHLTTFTKEFLNSPKFTVTRRDFTFYPWLPNHRRQNPSFSPLTLTNFGQIAGLVLQLFDKPKYLRLRLGSQLRP